jgi:hypothetical protein
MAPVRDLLPRLGEFLDRPNPPRLGFIGGQGKSGTSWVQMLLDAHPDVSALGEGHLAGGLGAPIMRTLAEYRGALQANNLKFPDLPDFPLPEDADAVELARVALLLQFRKLSLRKPRATILLDRTPGDISHVGELREMFPAAKFVHVLRDPRDIAVSLWWHGNRIEPGHWQRQTLTRNELAMQVVVRWDSMIRHVRATVRAVHADMFETRYEDLHDDPNRSAARLFDFVGVSSEQSIVDSALSASRFEQVSGGRVPGQTDSSSHFRDGRANGWRDSLPDWQPANVPASARALLEELGYPQD